MSKQAPEKTPETPKTLPGVCAVREQGRDAQLWVGTRGQGYTSPPLTQTLSQGAHQVPELGIFSPAEFQGVLLKTLPPCVSPDPRTPVPCLCEPRRSFIPGNQGQ